MELLHKLFLFGEWKRRAEKRAFERKMISAYRHNAKHSYVHCTISHHMVSLIEALTGCEDVLMRCCCTSWIRKEYKWKKFRSLNALELVSEVAAQSEKRRRKMVPWWRIANTQTYARIHECKDLSMFIRTVRNRRPIETTSKHDYDYKFMFCGWRVYYYYVVVFFFFRWVEWHEKNVTADNDINGSSRHSAYCSETMSTNACTKCTKCDETCLFQRNHLNKINSAYGGSKSESKTLWRMRSERQKLHTRNSCTSTRKVKRTEQNRKNRLTQAHKLEMGKKVFFPRRSLLWR